MGQFVAKKRWMRIAVGASSAGVIAAMIFSGVWVVSNESTVSKTTQPDIVTVPQGTIDVVNHEPELTETVSSTTQQTYVEIPSDMDVLDRTTIQIKNTTAQPKVVAAQRGTSGAHAPFGMSLADTLPGLSAYELAEQLNDMVTLGVTWIRIDFDWSWLQTNRDGAIDWTKIDRVVNAARARNLSILPILVYTPTWARTETCSYSNRCPPANPDDFASFATEAVNRYAPQGIHHWEIWNEPNMKGSWMPQADSAGYTKLLKSAYTAIKHIDPTAVVITGGLGPIASTNWNVAPLEFLQGMYDDGAQGYFDAVGFHPYSFPVVPSNKQTWNAWQQMNETRTSIRSILQAHGDGGKKIWITEYGAPTDGPGDSATSGTDYGNKKTDHVTEDFQATILNEALSDIRTHTWAGPFFWYSYKDLGTSRNTIENFFGLIRADGTTKPAYELLRHYSW